LAQLSADSSAQGLALDRYKKRIKNNDSLIVYYQREVKAAESQSAEFLSRAAGKDNQKYINLTSRDPKELTNAFAIISYYNNRGTEKMIDSAIVINKWYRDVFVVIKGPGTFRSATNLNPGEKVVVKIPGPGNYSVTFSHGDVSKTVSRYVDCINSDVYNKQNYSFLAVLPGN